MRTRAPTPRPVHTGETPHGDEAAHAHPRSEEGARFEGLDRDALVADLDPWPPAPVAPGPLPPSPRPSRATDARPGELMREAERLSRAGDTAGATAAYTRVLRDDSLPRAERAGAALAIGENAFRTDAKPRRAEYFFVRARDLAPDVARDEPGLRLELKLLAGAGRTAEALAVTERLLALRPDDPGVLLTQAKLLTVSSRAKDGVAPARRALALVEAGGDAAAIVNARMRLGHTLYVAGKVAEAIAQYRTVLAVEPENDWAHTAIAELVLPNFRGPHRGAIDAKFTDANAAYQRGDYAKVRALALEIVALDPNDGLAHRMFGIANQRLSEQRRGVALMAPLDSEPKRRAVLTHLEGIFRAAGATPRDLFPEWDQLSEQQRATVAYSILGYAKVLPELLARTPRPQYHLVGPGTSGTVPDPEKQADSPPNAFGRHFYAIRGWYRSGFVVSGTESIDAAARGGYNTITHEFAHVVHHHLGQKPFASFPPALQKLVLEQHGLRDELDRVLAGKREKLRAAHEDPAKGVLLFDDVVEVYYQQARAGRDGQSLLDAYSGNTVREYFAQGMMAYLNPGFLNEENARRLYDRGPRLWALTRAVAETTRSFPAAVPAIDHPPMGADAEGTALALDRWRREGSAAGTRLAAQGLLDQLGALYAPPAAPAQPPWPRVKNGDEARAGRSWAASGGEALANRRALSGDAALQAELRAALKTPRRSEAALDTATRGFWQGVLEADRLGECARASTHPDAGAFDPETRRTREALALRRAGELALIEVGARPPGFLGDPAAMIGAMGATELRAQVQAELACLDRLAPRYPGDARLAALRAALTDLGGSRAGLVERRERLLELHRELAAFAPSTIA